MSEESKWTRQIPVAVIIIGGLLGATGWVSASFLLGKVAHDDLIKTISELFLEFCKTILVAGFVAFVLDRYLKGVFGEGKDVRIAESGIADVFPNRRNAARDMTQCVREASSADICGISLQDFLLTNGTFGNVWDAIAERLVREEKDGVHKDKRFRVRLLMLHPKSSEGLFRHSAERTTIGGGKSGIPFDIPQGLDEVKRVQAMIVGVHGHELLDEKQLAHVRQFLDVKLYHHCPFSFLLLTNKDAFVEQYYYKNHRRHVDIPLLRYEKKELQDEFRTSFGVIWDFAKAGILKECEVSTAAAIESCGIRNIFAKDQRTQSGVRQDETLASVGSGKLIRILSISGKFYISGSIIPHLKDASDRGATVQFLLLNPVCGQAVLRGIADSYPPDEIKKEVMSWNWDKHRKTNLYSDIHRTILELNRRIDNGCRFEVRLHHSAPACSLFLTPDKTFIEQYIYGRSIAFVKNRVLGAEFPLIEFGHKDWEYDSEDTSEMQMLSSTFDVIWKCYSVAVNDYLKLNEESEFQTTLSDLARWNKILG